MSRLALLALLIGAPWCSGCGTLADAFAGPADDHLYYRGVRMDVAGIKNGAPIMALDLPLSACTDTLLVPSIAFQQLTNPEVKHKSAMQAVGEEMGKTMVNGIVVPMSTELMKAQAEMQQQQTVTPTAASETRRVSGGIQP